MAAVDPDQRWWRRHLSQRSRLTGMAFRMLGSHPDAEDVAQGMV